MASLLPSLYPSPTESIRFNTLQGVSLMLLECSPCVSLTFLTCRPPPRAQSPAVILYSFGLETFFCLPTSPVCAPMLQPSLPLFSASGISPATQREAVLSANGPPQVPQDVCSLRIHNQALSMRGHLLIASLCCPLLYNCPKSSFSPSKI